MQDNQQLIWQVLHHLQFLVLHGLSCRGMLGGWSQSNDVIVWEAGYMLDKSPYYHGADTQTTIHAHIYTYG